MIQENYMYKYNREKTSDSNKKKFFFYVNKILY